MFVLKKKGGGREETLKEKERRATERYASK